MIIIIEIAQQVPNIFSEFLNFGAVGTIAILFGTISYTFFIFFKKEIKRSQSIEKEFRDFLKSQNKYQAEIIKENTNAYREFINYMKKNNQE